MPTAEISRAAAIRRRLRERVARLADLFNTLVNNWDAAALLLLIGLVIVGLTGCGGGDPLPDDDRKSVPAVDCFVTPERCR